MAFRKALVCAALLMPPAAFADSHRGPAGFVDLFYTPKSNLTLSDATFGSIKSDGGSGFGVRGRFALSPEFFAQGEYVSDSFDGFEGVTLKTDIDFFRAGVGGSVTGSPFYGLVEFIHESISIGNPINDDESDSGIGLHGGVQGHPSDASTLYAEVGYVSVGDAGDGIEFMLGGAVNLNPSAGLFAEYRQTKEEDSGTEAKLGDFHVGVRISFGG